MRLTIDASNIVSGGGLTHLVELLDNAKPERYGFSEVEVWGREETLLKLKNNKWLIKRTHHLLNKGYVSRYIWKHLIFKKKLNKKSIVFIPGTGYIKTKGKVITMCRNLLPLERQEMNRYFFSLQWIRLWVLRCLHLYSYKMASGVIFLNHYSFNALPLNIRNNVKNKVFIAHGVNKGFLIKKNDYSYNNYFELLNISSISLYRHQVNLVKAVAELFNEGHDYIRLKLIGPPGRDYDNLMKNINLLGKEKRAIKYMGVIPYDELSIHYRKADSFIYSSTCETFGMT